MSEGEIAFVNDAKETGIFAPFKMVMQKAFPSETTPKFPERFFIKWLRLVGPQQVMPREMVDAYTKDLECDASQITYYSREGIGMITVSGAVRCFIPSVLVVGRKIRSRKGQGTHAISASLPTLHQWIRTRNGYVIGRGEMYENLKKKSAGEFALPGI